MSNEWITQEEFEIAGYSLFEPDGPEDPMQPEPSDRYFVVVRYKSNTPGDPIPWLASIYRAELVESYWRGTKEEAEDALTEYLSQRVSSDD